MIKKINPTLIFPFVLVLYEIVNYLSNDMYLPALPEMIRSFNISAATAQLTLTWWFAGMAMAPLLMGVWADRYGRRPVLLIGGVMYTLSSLVCTITTNIDLFMVARFVQGAMVPAMFVAGYAVIHESYEKKAAIKILALMASISLLAPALGPLLGGIILLFGSWRLIFGFITLWSLLNVIALYRVMPETRVADQSTTLHWPSLFSQYRDILLNHRFMLLTFLLGCDLAGFLVWITASPLLIIDHFARTPVIYGWIQAVVFAANLLGNVGVKAMIDRTSASYLIQLGLLICLMGGAGGIAAGLFFQNTPYPFVISMMVFAFGSGIVYAPLNRLAIETSDAPMGMRVAVFTACCTVFFAAGTVLSGFLYRDSILSVSSIIGTLSVMNVVIYLLFNRLMVVPAKEANVEYT